MPLYRATYWTGNVETIEAPSARDAALTIYSEAYLDRYSIADDLLPPDTMAVLSKDFEHVCTIKPDRASPNELATPY